MRERSESRERNDDWNRDDDDDDRMRERRNEEEKIPVWTRRRPTGFDVMPEGEQREVYVLVGFFFMIISLSLFRSRIVSIGFVRFAPHLAASFFTLSFSHM